MRLYTQICTQIQTAPSVFLDDYSAHGRLPEISARELQSPSRQGLETHAPTDTHLHTCILSCTLACIFILLRAKEEAINPSPCPVMRSSKSSGAIIQTYQPQIHSVLTRMSYVYVSTYAIVITNTL